MSALVRFMIVGGVGFVVDGTVLTALVAAGLDRVSSRVLSFSVAVVVTWWLNSRWSFREARTDLTGFVRYLATQSLGTAVNFALYLVCIQASTFMHRFPAVASSVGAAVAAIVNYVAITRWALRKAG